MQLWKHWWDWTRQLRPACARHRTFMWMLVVLMGFTVRVDLLGVTSFVRCLGLQEPCYDRMLDFLHSTALDVSKLTRAWTALVLRLHPGLLCCNGRVVLGNPGSHLSCQQLPPCVFHGIFVMPIVSVAPWASASVIRELDPMPKCTFQGRGISSRASAEPEGRQESPSRTPLLMAKV